MLNKRTLLWLSLLIASVAVVAFACGDDEPSDDGSTSGAQLEVDGTVIAGVTLSILSPEDGATVTSPVSLDVAVGGGVLVEPAEDKVSGAIHYFSSVDGAQASLAGGTTIARGEEQAGIYQWAAGSVELDLLPGEHTVIVGLADSEDSIVGVQAEVTFTVEEIQ